MRKPLQGLTIEQAKALRPGNVLYHLTERNYDNTPQRWRVTGQPKVWKTNPNRVRVPVKHGLYDFGYITEDNLNLLTLGL